METFEFLVTSIAMVTLQEHIKIQAQDLDDAITRIEDNIKGKFYIPFVLEDNCKCVEMWRNEGLICLQPNEGKF